MKKVFLCLFLFCFLFRAEISPATPIFTGLHPSFETRLPGDLQIAVVLWCSPVVSVYDGEFRGFFQIYENIGSEEVFVTRDIDDDIFPLLFHYDQGEALALFYEPGCRRALEGCCLCARALDPLEGVLGAFSEEPLTETSFTDSLFLDGEGDEEGVSFDSSFWWVEVSVVVFRGLPVGDVGFGRRPPLPGEGECNKEPVWEPGSFWLLVVGLLALKGLRRRGNPAGDLSYNETL